MASELRYLQQWYAEATFDRAACSFSCVTRPSFLVYSAILSYVLVHVTDVLLKATFAFLSVPLEHPPSASPPTIPSNPFLLVPHLSPVTESNITYATCQASLVLVARSSLAPFGAFCKELRGPPRHTSISESRRVARIARASAGCAVDGTHVCGCVLLADLRCTKHIPILDACATPHVASFPPVVNSTSAVISAALPAYEIPGSVFDWSFLVSAGFVVVVEWMRGRAWDL
jgi:hypothetical protein